MIAKVYVNVGEPTADKAYDYLVTPILSERIVRGQRVVVPFGKGNKKLEGIVVDVTDEIASERVKPVAYVLDEDIVSEYVLSAAEFVKERCFCTYFDALRPWLTPGGYSRFYEKVSVSDSADLSACDDDERALCLYIKEKGTLTLSELELTYKNRKKSITSLIEKGLLEIELSGDKRASDKTVRCVEAVPDKESEIKSAKHKAVYDKLIREGMMSVKELIASVGCTVSVISTMQKHGFVNVLDVSEMRSFYKPGKREFLPIKLSAEQSEAYDGLVSLADSTEPAAALLYGVTGSGKTSVYIRLIEHVIKSGRTAIMLLPEIGLSPQVFAAFYNYFGDIVGLMHSKMSQGERRDEYMRIKRGEVKIVVGTRMAIFSNLENIGVIIIDEEQEHTYISEMPPKYRTIDIAKYRCAKDNALLVLGSATPSLESFYYAKTGRYSLFTLKERYGGVMLPDIEAVDMTREFAMGNPAQISGRLLYELDENLKRGEQSILFLNRRGYSTFVSCSSCGHVVKCPNCSVPLRYHKKNGRLLCHICSHSEEIITKCPECGNELIKFSGTGTQKIEDQLSELLPDARIMRMDADTTMNRRAHDEMLSAFSKGEADILIGTQMVSKGLDFDRVTLVGVLNGDAAMFSDDFRGAEISFSQITQVTGRAGRRNIRGRAIIQTTAPKSQLIAQCMEGDYEKFYESEIELRRALIYPPFCDLAQLTVSSHDEEMASSMVHTLDMILKRNLNKSDSVKVIILGPAPPSVAKVNNKFRMRIILKCRNTKKLRDLLRCVMQEFSKEKKGAKVTLSVEINPANL